MIDTVPSADDGRGVTASALSDRELDVARLVVDGLTYKEIGGQLYISPKTVEHHVAKIRQKLGATTRAEMLAALKSELL
jgi:DNA-binding CsgD family transcriptional regulator